MESYYEDITPELARKYLAHHGGNRNLNANAVADYARDMAAGRWHLTHQGIAFSDTGELLDGQHRLQAIIRAGIAVRMYVTKGVDPDAFKVLDTGRQRTLADRFQIEGAKNANQLAAVARKVTLWEMGKPWSRSISPTREEIAAVLDKHPELIEAAGYAHGWPSRRTLPASQAGFCWWLFGTLDIDDRDDFMSKLRTGDSLPPLSPILALRERLMARYSGGGPRTGLTKPEALMALTVLAWNHYRRRSEITKLQLPSVLNDETFPRPI